MVPNMAKFTGMCILAALACFHTRSCAADGSPQQYCVGGMQFGDRCYWFSTKELTWMDAYRQCNSYGAEVQLVTITNQEQQNWLANKLPYRDFWIGLHDTHKNEHWLWVDLTFPNYTNWTPSRPTNSTSDNCAIMTHSGGWWKDVPCNSKHHYACSTTSNFPLCHSGGIFFRDRCYWLLEKDFLIFSKADTACRSVENGARPVIIRDGELNAFLSKLIHPVLWIGLQDVKKESRWEWIDGSQLGYRNWLPGEPNNAGNHEDCATLQYGTGGWNDVPCTIARIYTHRVVCALPPCDDEGSGDAGVCPDENPFCTCVSSGYCLENGRCHCVKMFHEMECDKANVRVNLRSASHVNEGESIELKCHVNIPKRDYSVQIHHVTPEDDRAFLPENRTEYYINSEENGYTKVVISNVTSEDSGSYVCIASTTAGESAVTKIASVYVKVRSNTTSHGHQKPITHKDTKHPKSPKQHKGSSATGLTTAVAVLSVCCVFLIIALVVVKGLARRREQNYRSNVQMSSLLPFQNGGPEP